MTNNHHTQSTDNSLPRRDRQASAERTRSVVRQDNPAPPPAPSATPQPAPRKKGARTAPKDAHTNSPHQKINRPGKDVQLNLWVRPVVKTELERIAKREGLSVSTTGEALLEKALQEDIHAQHAALLEPIIDKAIGKHMRAYSNRLAVLLVRSVFATEQIRSIVTNILSRQDDMTQKELATIITASDNKARGNITRITPQLKTLIEAVQNELMEEVKASG